MRVRPIHAGELDLFIEAVPDRRKETENYMKRMFDAGSMRPEWCFVAGEGRHVLGRVAFWTLPGMDAPFALVLLDVAWEDDEYTNVGGRLLEDVLERARSLGAEDIEHVLDDPPMEPQFQNHPEKRIELLESAGFSPTRETNRFEYRGEKPPTISNRLSFHTLEEVGEETFVAAMAKVSEGTLDREIREERGRLGPEGAARDFFEDARRVRHDPSWWRLAYEKSSGELAGLVMPAHPPAFLTIFYVGVAPKMRGRGYVDILLAAGTATLLGEKSGAPLRADTDVANAPMAAAFERAGWASFANRREYVANL